MSAYVSEENTCHVCGEPDYGDGPRWARLRCDLRFWFQERINVQRRYCVLFGWRLW